MKGDWNPGTISLQNLSPLIGQSFCDWVSVGIASSSSIFSKLGRSTFFPFLTALVWCQGMDDDPPNNSK